MWRSRIKLLPFSRVEAVTPRGVKEPRAKTSKSREAFRVVSEKTCMQLLWDKILQLDRDGWNLRFG